MLRCRPFVLLLVLLTGCTNLYVMSHVPLSTMSRLASLHFTEIDLAALRVAVLLPEALEPRPEGVKVRLESGGGDGQTVSEFVLERVTEASEGAALTAYNIQGTRLWVYRLAPKDLDRLNRLRGEAAEKHISMSVSADACRRAPLEQAPLPLTTFLRIDGSGYFMLVDDLDLRSVIPERELAARVPPCR